VIPGVSHALKGVSANVGANRLASLASSLMQMSSDEVDSCRDRVSADLRECAQLTVAALRKTIADSRTLSASG